MLPGLLLGTALALGAAAPASAQGDPGAPQIALQTVTTGLDKPIDITNAGDGTNRLFIAQQNGIVRIYDLNTNQLLATPFIDISGLITPGDPVGDFEGLLGIAFHPNYGTNGRFFLSYVDINRIQVLARFTVSAGDANIANPTPDAILLTITYPQADFPHYGGQIQFGPDGYLYMSTGDGGETGGLPVNLENAQNLDVLLGKVLRLDVDNGNPYSIPSTNPFVGTPNAREEIWARGMRNPWRFSFDRFTGELFLTDVGDSAREEADVQPAASPGGENYGWSRMEGSLCFSPATNCNDGTLVLPTFEYAHTQDPCGGSISGGYRYRGDTYPQLKGMYIFSDFCRHDVRGAFQLSDGSWKQMLLLNLATAFPPNGFNIVGFGEDEAGEVYVGGFFEHKVFHITSSDNPVPVLTSIAPDNGTAGSGPLTLVVTGSNFKVNSVVRWNGSDRTTLFVSDTELHASLSAGDLANGGLVDVTVFTPPNGGGVSNSVSFTLNNPTPALTSLTPSAWVEHGPQFTLDLSGSSFVPGSLVRWNGADRQTSFVSSTHLTALIPASDVVSIGTAQVTVFTPAPGGGISNAKSFVINNVRNPLPTVTGLGPPGVVAGNGGFLLVVTGSNFVASSGVRWNGTDRPTTFVSSAQLQASIASADVANPGTATVSVFTPGPGGGTSNGLVFSINATPNLPPAIGSLNPPSAVVGANRTSLTLDVMGSKFIPGSVVRWNGMNRATVFVNAGHLTASIPTSDLATAGTAMVTVFTPAPGGGTSNAELFVINNALPTLSGVSPGSVAAGSEGVILVVTGANFVPGSLVRWNGSNRPTTFIGNNQLRATIPASDLELVGSASVTVMTPGPGGGESAPMTLAISSASVTPPEIVGRQTKLSRRPTKPSITRRPPPH